MAKVDWVWYHKQSISSSGTTTYFNTDEATSGTNVTNMKMAGQLPSAEKFTIKSIQVFFDPADAVDDIETLLGNTVLELVIGEETKIKAPLFHFVPQGNITGYAALYGQASETERSAAGLGGTVWTFENPIVLPGGVGFKVDLHVGTAPSAAVDVTVSLVGVREY